MRKQGPHQGGRGKGSASRPSRNFPEASGRLAGEADDKAKRPRRPANRPHITYPARAGHVLLFESWLRHEVAANRTTAERISVSFNYNWS